LKAIPFKHVKSLLLTPGSPSNYTLAPQTYHSFDNTTSDFHLPPVSSSDTVLTGYQELSVQKIYNPFNVVSSPAFKNLGSLYYTLAPTIQLPVGHYFAGDQSPYIPSKTITSYLLPSTLLSTSFLSAYIKINPFPPVLSLFLFEIY